MFKIFIPILVIGLAGSAFAEEPAKELSKETVVTELVKEKEADKPEKVPACAPTQEDGDETLLGCSQHLAKVTKGYERALEEWKAFAVSASNRLANAAKKESEAKTQIQKNSAEILKLKFKRNRENKNKIKELERANKELWKKLKSITKEKEGLCKGLAKEGSRKHSELGANISARWKGARSALR